jgi:hypothetical protein
MDENLGGLFTSDDDGKNITVHLPEKKYHFDFNFSWLVWIALMLMIVFFVGDPDLHDAVIDSIMHKNHKQWASMNDSKLDKTIDLLTKMSDSDAIFLSTYIDERDCSDGTEPEITPDFEDWVQ